MGLFIKNHGKTDAAYVRNNYTPTADPTGTYIYSGINSIFGLLTSYADGKGSSGDGAGGVDPKGKVSKEAQKEIDELNTKIDAKLKEANAADIADLSSKITASQEAQKTLETSIEQIKTNIKDFQKVINDYPSNLNSLETQLKQATDDTQKAFINSSIQQLKKDKENAEAQIKILNKKLEEEENKLKEEKIKEVELTTIKGEVENYQHRIDELKNELSKEVTYDVKKESDDIANFSDALKKFKDSPSQDTASAVISAYKADGNKIDNKTVKKAYELLVKQYPNYFNKVEL